MKFLNLLFLITVCSCISTQNFKEKIVFSDEFLNKDAVYDALALYYQGHPVIIYDKEQVLAKTSRSYGKGAKKIDVETTKPIHQNYFVIYNFTLNKNLATIVLATSNLDNGIIYYLKKDHSTNNEWVVMNAIHKNSR